MTALPELRGRCGAARMRELEMRTGARDMPPPVGPRRRRASPCAAEPLLPEDACSVDLDASDGESEEDE